MEFKLMVYAILRVERDWVVWVRDWSLYWENIYIN